MDNFKIIYRILKHLEMSMDCEVLDTEAISHSRLGITRGRWEQLLIMMQDEGYIHGIATTQSLSDSHRRVAEPIAPEITIKGLEYLTENSFMKKAANLVKGVKDSMPGL